MHRLLARPVSRVVHVQRTSLCSRSLARGLSTSTRRNFDATAPVNKRNSAYDANVFGDLIDGAAPKEPKGSSSTPKTKSQQQANPPRLENTVLESTSRPSSHHSDGPLGSSFEPTQYFESWSIQSIDPHLARHNITLLDYIMSLAKTQLVANTLSSFDPQQSLDFKKRWLSYELDQDNPEAHFGVLEFLLQQGIRLLPPGQRITPLERVTKVDSVMAQRALASVDGPWHTRSNILEQYKPERVEFPDLMQSDPYLDPRDVTEFPPSTDSPFHNRVVVRNHRSVFHDYIETTSDDLLEDDELPEENTDQNEMFAAMPVSTKYYNDLYQSILMRRSVVLQTGKGKIRRVAFMVLVGDGDGLVGYGEGKHSNGATALKKARLAAVKNMDWVERFEKRTIWTEMRTKLGATEIILRPRPVGFGLRCNPHLHRILRAAGLKDISAKVWGSRNKLNVIKAAFRILHAGHAPTGMGDGMGGKGRKLSKGGGLKSKSEVERARGRKLINLRK